MTEDERNAKTLTDVCYGCVTVVFLLCSTLLFITWMLTR